MSSWRESDIVLVHACVSAAELMDDVDCGQWPFNTACSSSARHAGEGRSLNPSLAATIHANQWDPFASGPLLPGVPL